MMELSVRCSYLWKNTLNTWKSKFYERELNYVTYFTQQIGSYEIQYAAEFASI